MQKNHFLLLKNFKNTSSAQPCNKNTIAQVRQSEVVSKLNRRIFISPPPPVADGLIPSWILSLVGGANFFSLSFKMFETAIWIWLLQYQLQGFFKSHGRLNVLFI